MIHSLEDVLVMTSCCTDWDLCPHRPLLTIGYSAICILMAWFSWTTWDLDWLGQAVGFLGTESTCWCETGYAGNPVTEPNALLLIPSYSLRLPLWNGALWWTNGASIWRQLGHNACLARPALFTSPHWVWNVWCDAVLRYTHHLGTWWGTCCFVLLCPDMSNFRIFKGCTLLFNTTLICLLKSTCLTCHKATGSTQSYLGNCNPCCFWDLGMYPDWFWPT